MNRKGFTLIELLVVVLIIGILASVAMPQYFKVVEKGRVSEGLATISALTEAQGREELRNGDWTTDMNGLDITVANLKFFNVALTSNQIITLTRKATPTPPSDYGQYTIVYNRTTKSMTSNSTNARAMLP